MAEAALRRWVDSGRQQISSTTPVPGSPWTMSIAGETVVRFSLDTTTMVQNLKSLVQTNVYRQ